MRIWEVIVLGILQGFTEFLPVSSSGHLVLAQDVLGMANPGVALELVLHLGTLLSVFIVFWSDILGLLQAFFSFFSPSSRRGIPSPELKVYRRLILLLILGILPTALLGILFQPFFENIFSSVRAVGVFLLLTGVVLFVISRLPSGPRSLARMNGKDALTVGFAQGLAIMPGLSRSGMTISAALARGLDRESATRFSFLISIPTILGASLLEAKAIFALGSDGQALPLLLGFFVSAAAGVLAIKVLVKLLRQGKLAVFAYYVWLLGLLALWQPWRI